MEIYWPSKLTIKGKERFAEFLTMMVKRIVVGELRYGSPKVDKEYLTRLKLELKAYQKTGNMEHLITIANYAWLESECPENHKFHFDSNVGSATRGKV